MIKTLNRHFWWRFFFSHIHRPRALARGTFTFSHSFLRRAFVFRGRFHSIRLDGENTEVSMRRSAVLSHLLRLPQVAVSLRVTLSPLTGYMRHL